MTFEEMVTAVKPEGHRAGGKGQAAEGMGARAWPRSQADFPAEGGKGVFFLHEGFVRAAAGEVGLDARDAQLAVETARRIAADEALARLAWHARYLAFVAPEEERSALRSFPGEMGALGKDTGLFYLVILLAGIDLWRRNAARRSLPRDVAADTLSDIRVKLNEYERWYGVRGLQPGSFAFLLRHVHGSLFQLGRLQFEMGPFRGSVHVWRRRRDGRVLALAADGTWYSRDGRLVVPPPRDEDRAELEEAAQVWQARLERREGCVVGHPVHPRGEALAGRCRLSLAEWEEVLAPGDPVLHLHIPSGAPLDPEQCTESLCRAEAFFPRHVPEFPFRAYSLGTWFLDAQLEGVLPPTANIVRFSRRFYRFPAPSSPDAALRFVFGPNRPADPAALPQRTTLERRLVEHLVQGKAWHAGRGFILQGDAGDSNHYRRLGIPDDLTWEPARRAGSASPFRRG